MIDFLRANTWCSQEEYKWGMTVPQVRLASMDFTHIEYLSDSEKNTGDKTSTTLEYLLYKLVNYNYYDRFSIGKRTCYTAECLG